MNELGRYASFEFRDSSEFIGEWSARMDCIVSRLPVRSEPPAPSHAAALGDAVLALSAVAAIFSIPLLIIFVTIR